MAEFLQLAQVYKESKFSDITIRNFFASEKIDGIRCLWDGGVSIGMSASDLPWGSTDRAATGLWSRYGKPIMCPAEFTSGLPPICLDGELSLPGGTFEELNSIVRRHEPDGRWRDIVFKIFDSPSSDLLVDRRVNNANMSKTLNFQPHVKALFRDRINDNRFQFTIQLLKSYDYGKYGLVLDQVAVKSKKHLDEMLDQVLVDGGEGLILRHALSVWEPKRSNMCLKVKPFLDSEGVVVGVNPGKGKYEGMMGSLDVKWRNPSGNDVVFSLSGFTDAERNMTWELNKVITFKYRRLTDEGVPYEARYLRAC